MFQAVLVSSNWVFRSIRFHPHCRTLLGPHKPLFRHQGVWWRGRADGVGASWGADRGHPELHGWRGHPWKWWRAGPCQRHPRHAHFRQLHPLTAWWQTVCLIQWHSGERQARIVEMQHFTCVSSVSQSHFISFLPLIMMVSLLSPSLFSSMMKDVGPA